MASPAFTIFAVASLAVGIGVSTAVYSAVRALFWAPLGVPNPSTLVTIADGGRARMAMSWPDFEDLQAQQTTFTSVCATSRTDVALSAAVQPEIVTAEGLSADCFRTFGVTPLLGRLLQAADDRSATPVAVVSEDFWRTSLGSSDAAPGRAIRVDGRSFTIVGVVKGAFRGLETTDPVSIWIPLRAMTLLPDGGTLPMSDRSVAWFSIWARLDAPPGFARAESELSVIGRRLDESYPRGVRRDRRWRARAADAISRDQAGDSIGTLVVVAVAMVLFIACTNVANLVLARTSARSQEIAVRMALGASRGRLVREQATESVLVALVAGATGIALLRVLLGWISANLRLPFGSGGSTVAFHPTADASVLTAALVATVLAATVSGIWPAVQSTREVRATLGSGAAATPANWRAHRLFVAWQVAGSAALLLVAAMCVQIVEAIPVNRPDTAHTNLALAEVDFGLNGRSASEMRVDVDRIVDAARRRGVGDLAVSSSLPFGWYSFPVASVAAAGRPGGSTQGVSITGITPEFPHTVGLRLLAGRWITRDDQRAAVSPVVVNARLARTMFQSIDVIGREIEIRTLWTPRLSPGTIVGIVADTDVASPHQRGALEVFAPFGSPATEPLIATFVAHSGRPAAAVSQLRAAIAETDSNLAVSRSGTGNVLLRGPLIFFDTLRWLCLVLGALALVLASAGLFGVLSHVVSRRTREMGIRLAIGASRRQIFALVLRDGSQPVAKGLALGLLMGVVGRYAVWSWMTTTASPISLWLLAMLPIPFAAAAALACSAPAWRASRTDPNVALREL